MLQTNFAINPNTHFMLSKVFHEIMWQKAEFDRSHVKIKCGPEKRVFRESRQTHNILYLLLHNILIPSDFVNLKAYANKT
jgi:hypothetical protein